MKTSTIFGAWAILSLLPLKAQTDCRTTETNGMTATHRSAEIAKTEKAAATAKFTGSTKVIETAKVPDTARMHPDSLIADFDYFTKLLKSTHPDPYSGFGGKVFFHKKAHELRNRLYYQPCTLQEFWDEIMTFLSPLQDSHTSLNLIHTPTDHSLWIPIRLRCFPEGLIVQTLPAASKDLLGSLLIGINEKSMPELLSLTAEKYACENTYDRYFKLYNQLPNARFIRQLFPDVKDSVCFHLLTPQQDTVRLMLPFVDADSDRACEKVSLPDSGRYPKGQLDYGFIDEKKQIMLVKINSIQARDNFEYMYRNGWDFYSQLAAYYRQVLKKEMPQDTVQAIHDLPSFSGTFARLLNDMKREKSSDLIIDLRGNGGGWTPITLPTLYQLFGDKYLQTDMQTHYYRLISPLYLQKIGKTLEEFNRQTQYKYEYGDYTFGTIRNEQVPLDTLRSQFIANCLSCIKEDLQSMEGKPLYTPKNLYVLTDEKTFSAAFHYAFFLWKMGATLVGVPSRQAPNTYMEQTPFELPHTRLKGSISNSIQIFLPEKDKRAKIFFPDQMPSYEDYKKYGFDQQSEIMFLLDYIQKKRR